MQHNDKTIMYTHVFQHVHACNMHAYMDTVILDLLLLMPLWYSPSHTYTIYDPSSVIFDYEPIKVLGTHI